jgi:hypothetical protein
MVPSQLFCRAIMEERGVDMPALFRILEEQFGVFSDCV